MTQNLWRETRLLEPEQTQENDIGDDFSAPAAPIRPEPRRSRRPGAHGSIADAAPGDLWLACDAGPPDATAPRLLLTAARCLIAAQLDPRAVEEDVAVMLGASHRRVTILLRTLLCEMALHARRRIRIGSPCRSRPTEDEARLLAVVAASADDGDGAHAQAAVLLGGGATDRVVPLAAALGEAMRDAGLPMQPAETRAPRRTVH
jgi:hypothetical protein